MNIFSTLKKHSSFINNIKYMLLNIFNLNIILFEKREILLIFKGRYKGLGIFKI